MICCHEQLASRSPVCLLLLHDLWLYSLISNKMQIIKDTFLAFKSTQNVLLLCRLCVIKAELQALLPCRQ